MEVNDKHHDLAMKESEGKKRKRKRFLVTGPSTREEKPNSLPSLRSK